MGHRQSNHRPLRAGIAITPSGGMPGMGTLGAVARRNSDLANILPQTPPRRPHPPHLPTPPTQK